ncbi:MAG: hypothetical protein AB7F89_05345 [Pirellulaceae bacterium]
MDFINKAVAQLTELFRSMTPAARITTGMLFGVIVVSLIFLFRYQADHADEYLFGAEVLTRNEVAALEAAFAKAGLNIWDANGNRVRVPRSQKHTYLAAAADDNAIPQSLTNPWETMLQQGSPLDTRDVRERRAQVARTKLLDQVLRSMNDIEEAYVTIEETSPEGFPPRTRKRAMAAVKGAGSRQLEQDRIRQIRLTVASGAGVAPEDVTVSDLNGGVYPGASKDGEPIDSHHHYAAVQRQFESDYRRKIYETLSTMVPGVSVAVSVELDKDQESHVNIVKYDDQPTVVQTNTRDRESTSKSGDLGGRVGADPNGVNSNRPASVSTAQNSNESTEKDTQANSRNVVGATQTTTKKAGLVPVWITASIGVPTSHFRKVWLARNPAIDGQPPKEPTPDELKQIETELVKNIEDVVAPLLPRPPQGNDMYKPVKVVTYTETPTELPAEPSLASEVGYWFANNWQTLGLFTLAAFGVVFLRGMIRSSQAAAQAHREANGDAPANLSIASDSGDEDEEDHSPESVANSLKRRFQNSGRSLKDELTDLVREDPDAAANILKLWISDAA